jgi:RNA recognition motif-containing protein
MSVQIYAGNLSYQMTQDNLQELFEQYGDVSSAKIITDKHSGRSKGFGFVEMISNEQAQAAIENLNEKEVAGRNIRVNYAKPRDERS